MSQLGASGAIGAALVGVVLIGGSAWAQGTGELRVRYIDVGQGDASPGFTPSGDVLAIDAGSAQNIHDPEPPPNGAAATRMEALDFGWIRENATLVFRAELVEQELERTADGLLITRNYFRPIEIYEGVSDEDEADGRVVLTTVGGQTDDEIFHVPHMPMFRRGIQYLLFSTRLPTGELMLTGNRAGVVLLHEERVYTYEGLPVLAVQDDRLRLGAALAVVGLAETDGELALRRVEPTGHDEGVASIDMRAASLERTPPGMSLNAFLEAVFGPSRDE